ncbi:MAG TPA: DUF397 domain-containing protein [Pseudonocardiaceae bacterium]
MPPVPDSVAWSSCVEVADTLDQLRDSKNPGGPVLQGNIVALIQATKKPDFRAMNDNGRKAVLPAVGDSGEYGAMGRDVGLRRCVPLPSVPS